MEMMNGKSIAKSNKLNLNIRNSNKKWDEQLNKTKYSVSTSTATHSIKNARRDYKTQISEHDCKIQPHVEEQKGSVDKEGVVVYVHPDKEKIVVRVMERILFFHGHKFWLNADAP